MADYHLTVNGVPAIFHEGEDGTWWAEFPSIPNYSAVGLNFAHLLSLLAGDFFAPRMEEDGGE